MNEPFLRQTYIMSPRVHRMIDRAVRRHLGEYLGEYLGAISANISPVRDWEAAGVPCGGLDVSGDDVIVHSVDVAERGRPVEQFRRDHLPN